MFCFGRLVSLNILHILSLSAETFAASLPPPSSLLPTLPQTTSSLLSPFLWTLYALTSQQAHLTPPALLPSDSTTSWAAKWCKSKHPEDLLASQSFLSSFSVSLSAGKSESFQSKNHPSFFTTNNNLFSTICTLLDPLFLPMFW